MNVVTILRYYLGISQMELATQARVSCADVNEIENNFHNGMIEKYRKLAKYLHVPVQAIAMNDILSVPEIFFQQMREAKCVDPPKSKNGRLGREGEEAAFKQEQERLAQVNPCLAKLVIPNYKLRGSRGYDIISYKEDGTPFFIEVKTSNKDNTSVQLTGYEFLMANKLTNMGYEYWIYHYSGWGTENPSFEKNLYGDLREENRIEPVRYLCDLKPKKKMENGILHFRRKMGISQIEAANLMEIPPSCLCKYETGENQCPVTAYQKMSRLYQVTIDDLLLDYPTGL